MTQSPSLPELPKPAIPVVYAPAGGFAPTPRSETVTVSMPQPYFTADQMNAHYLKGYEAGSAAAAQAVPGDWLFRTKVADLLHLLTFASIEAPTAGDSGQARRLMDELRAMLAAPTQGAEGAAPQEEWDGICGTCDGRGCPTCHPEPYPDKAPTPTAPHEAAGATGKQALQVAQEADALREALAECLEDLEYLSKAPDSAYARPDDSTIAKARAALAQHQPQQGEGA